jgi:hypothetical protein
LEEEILSLRFTMTNKKTKAEAGMINKKAKAKCGGSSPFDFAQGQNHKPKKAIAETKEKQIPFGNNKKSNGKNNCNSRSPPGMTTRKTTAKTRAI